MRAEWDTDGSLGVRIQPGDKGVTLFNNRITSIVFDSPAAARRLIAELERVLPSADRALTSYDRENDVQRDPAVLAEAKRQYEEAS